MGLSIDFEFPSQVAADIGGSQQQKKANKTAKSQVSIPAPIDYKLNSKLKTRLENCSRKIKLFSRINIKIKTSDINTNLHHLVLLIFYYYLNLFLREVSG